MKGKENMRVLFGISNDATIAGIARYYEEKYNEKIEYDVALYFNDFSSKIASGDYDRALLSEELEKMPTKSYAEADRLIFEYIDGILNNFDAKDLVLLCSERRKLGDDFLSRLFAIGVYTTLTGSDRTKGKVCAALNTPYTRKDMRKYYDGKSSASEVYNAAEVSELELRKILATDVEATFTGDPAAESYGEIISCYPVIKAISNYRIAHELLLLGVPLIPRIITEKAHSETGIDIHPAASIGHHFTIDHGTGVVIGATCIIGNNVKLYQGVTLGAKSFPLDENGHPIKGIPRHPILEDNVIVYSNATILGRITISKGTVIGGNIWVTQGTKPGEQLIQSKTRKGNIKNTIIRPEDFGGL